MSGIPGITSKRSRLGSVAAAVILTSTLFLGSLAGPANAEEHDRGRREYQQRDYRNRGYYRAPPVVYGTPYYAPPVVYGPSPWGLNINIR